MAAVDGCCGGGVEGWDWRVAKGLGGFDSSFIPFFCSVIIFC
jgi:hypothetical protein